MATKYFVDKNGNYLGGFDGVKAPKGATEVPAAPDHAADTWNGSEWVRGKGRYKVERQAAFYQELPLTDQLDALYKYALMTPEERAALRPDPGAPLDTPEGWLAKVQDIKQRFPKD